MSGNSEDKEATLHYIDRLYEAQSRLGALGDRLLLTQTVLALILIALSTGIVAARDKFSVAGITFTISLSLILFVGSLLLSALTISFSAVQLHASTFAREISRIYERTGYLQGIRNDQIADPLH